MAKSSKTEQMRVVLDPVAQRALFHRYRILYGGNGREAAKSLNVKQQLYSGYELCHERSMPEDLFYELCGTIRMYRDNWSVDSEQIVSDPKYRKMALGFYRGILGSSEEVKESFGLKIRGNSFAMNGERAALVAETISEFSLGDNLDLSNPENLIRERRTRREITGAAIGRYIRSKEGNTSTSRGHSRMKEMYGQNYRVLFGKMHSIGVSIRVVREMNANSHISILDVMDSWQEGCNFDFLSRETGRDEKTVSHRCKALLSRGFIEQETETGKYKITERGRKLLWVHKKLKGAGRIN